MRAIYIESDRLYFKRLTLKHLSKEYVVWLNDKEVYKYLVAKDDYTDKKSNSREYAL